MVDLTDEGNVVIAATNQRTGREKTANTTADGWFSLDADYEDYLANSSAPWVANKDRIKLAMLDRGKIISEAHLNIDMAEDKQEAKFSGK